MSMSWPQLKGTIEKARGAGSGSSALFHLCTALHALSILHEDARFVVKSHDKILPAFKECRETAQRAINGGYEAREKLRSAIGKLGATQR